MVEVAADDRRQMRVRLPFEMREEIVEILLRRFRRRVASVQNRVNENMFGAEIERRVDESVQMLLQRMHAAIGEQSREVNRAMLLHRVGEDRVLLQLTVRNRFRRCERCPDRRPAPHRYSDARPRSSPSARAGRPDREPRGLERRPDRLAIETREASASPPARSRSTRLPYGSRIRRERSE